MPGVNPLAKALMGQFEGGGASGSWAPDPTLQERWNKTATKGLIDALMGAATLPGDVYQGKVDPYSDEAIKRSADLAMTLAGGGAAFPAKEGAAELGMGIRAYHGSPHSFEQFSSEKIGTGEGAQAYGHGLYFGEREAVGKEYRERLSASMPYLREGKPVAHGDLFQSMQEAAQAVPGTHPDQAYGITRQLTDALEEEGTAAKVAEAYDPPQGFEAQWNAALDAMKGVEWNKTPGHLYEVDIAAEPERFLDWDKQLNKQRPQVVDALKQAMGEKNWEEFQHADTGAAVRQGFIAFSDEGVSQKLKDAGVPGIKYVDQGSRADYQGWQTRQAEADALKAKGSPYAAEAQAEADSIKQTLTSNYVVFDDKLISILRKYGMGGMVGTAAGYEMAQHLMQQEGEPQPPVRGINPTQPTNSRLLPLLMRQTAPYSPNAT